jgi:hypothetical protein
MVNLNDFKTVYIWLRENHTIYKDFAKPSHCPTPDVLQDEVTQNIQMNQEILMWRKSTHAIIYFHVPENRIVQLEPLIHPYHLQLL